MACCTPLPPISKKGGDLASSITNKVIRQAAACAVRDAVARARSSCCDRQGAHNGGSPRGGTSSSEYLDTTVAKCAVITSAMAQAVVNAPLRGVSYGAYINNLEQKTLENYAPYNDPERRFINYRGHFIPPACVPTPIFNPITPSSSELCRAQIPAYMRPSH